MDLVRILFTRSAPYTPYVLAVLILQALSTAATLYLPSLNAKIIDEGVSKGDIDYIWDTGAIMLIVAFVQVITAIGAVWCGSRTAMESFKAFRGREPQLDALLRHQGMAEAQPA